MVTNERAVVYKTAGQRHGAITRLVSPGDLGHLLKPFIFLDLFDAPPNSFGGFGLHPHSGIATLTVLLQGATRYEDTTGATGVPLDVHLTLFPVEGRSPMQDGAPAVGAPSPVRSRAPPAT